MPRLSLYKPTKTNDFNFMDRQIREQFWVGGTGVHVHKYVGPAVVPTDGDPSTPDYIDGREIDPLSGDFINIDGIINETKIQDLLFMENRDRKYDSDIYELRGVYNVTDNDFELTQFGLFLSNDMLYMSFHMNEMVEVLGRKLLAGDVLELPHLRDDLLLNADKKAINKYYVISDANRGAEGFSPTWYPHIWRVKLSPLTDSQEYNDILGDAKGEGSLKDDISTYITEYKINDAVVASANAQDPDGTTDRDHLFGYDYATSGGIVNKDNTYNHGETIPTGTEFPSSPANGDYFIRTDFIPNRMFVRRGSKWHRVNDNLTDRTWTDITYNASDYINNKDTTVVGSSEFLERQPISQVITPKPDNEIEFEPNSAFSVAGYYQNGYVEDN